MWYLHESSSRWKARSYNILTCVSIWHFQGAIPQRMQDQVAQLHRLHWMLADTRRLASAVGEVEGNAAAKATLKV